MMIEDSSRSDASARLAANLRRLRVARHTSLSQLAHATSMSKATLSGIESARANPTLDTLTALARALDVSIAELLEPPPLGEIHIARAADSTPAGDAAPSERLLRDASAGAGRLEIVELALPAHTLRERDGRPAGSRSALFVLDGRLLAGPLERVSELARGDYASFPADGPHLYETQSKPARLLVLEHTPL